MYGELAEDLPQVEVDRVTRDEEPLPDLRVRQTLRHDRGYPELGVRQTLPAADGPLDPPPVAPVHPHVAQPRAYPRGVALRAHLLIGVQSVAEGVDGFLRLAAPGADDALVFPGRPA